MGGRVGRGNVSVADVRGDKSRDRFGCWCYVWRWYCCWERGKFCFREITSASCLCNFSINLFFTDEYTTRRVCYWVWTPTGSAARRSLTDILQVACVSTVCAFLGPGARVLMMAVHKAFAAAQRGGYEGLYMEDEPTVKSHLAWRGLAGKIQ